MSAEHRDITPSQVHDSVRPKALAGLPSDRLAVAMACDFVIDDFGAGYDAEAGSILCWALVTERVSGHTVRVCARWEPEYGKVEQVSLEGALLPYGHALRRLLEGSDLVEAAGARAWARWCEDEEVAAGW